ncbi:hypothetical protein [Citreimonas salinaria]|uniref:Uncharacterized protein n=1 Tax=Citreimonas salinaria TaxID=321339 RepID=A0A1H3KTY1_9RHOB|nr:hypothetical protein [Citreimonas salinaria]SDY55429.1 hypothetical protein SAMN05444340_11099 [Citreimonas salinaria]
MKLPQSGGSYTRDDKGGLKKVAGTAPAGTPKPAAKPAAKKEA